MKQTITCILTGLFLFAFYPNTLMAQKGWRWSKRLQIGIEHDNNVFESSRFPRPAVAGRLVLNSRLEKRGQKLNFLTSYSGGLQAYPEFNEEHKLTNDLSMAAGWRAAKWLQISTSLQGYFKIYLGNNLDFAHTVSDFKVDIFLPSHWAFAVGSSSSRLDYKHSDTFDFTRQAYFLALRRAITNRTMAELLGEVGNLNYLRPAFSVSPEAYLTVRGQNQNDRQTEVWGRLSLRRKFLLQLTLDWQQNRSNSFGYSYNRWRASLIAGWRASRRLLFRLASMLQYKKYKDALPPVFPLDLDVERNESNFLVADISLDANSNMAWLLRLSWYDNESAVRGLFYQKFLLFAGVEIRF